MNGQSLSRALPLELAIAPPDRLASLFDVHHERLYRLARRLAPSKDDALDLVQETFLRAARSPQSIPVGVSQEEAWLVRVLINIRRDQWRKKSIRDYHAKAGPALVSAWEIRPLSVAVNDHQTSVEHLVETFVQQPYQLAAAILV